MTTATNIESRRIANAEAAAGSAVSRHAVGTVGYALTRGTRTQVIAAIAAIDNGASMTDPL